MNKTEAPDEGPKGNEGGSGIISESTRLSSEVNPVKKRTSVRPQVVFMSSNYQSLPGFPNDFSRATTDPCSHRGLTQHSSQQSLSDWMT